MTLTSNVCECDDGAHALGIYRTFRPDLVLMDLEMKGLDGIAATRQIVSHFPLAKIVILTNHNDSSLRDAARAAGACGYLLKDEMLDIHSVLSRLMF